MNQIKGIISRQKDFFKTRQTLSYSFRMEMLARLRKALVEQIGNHETALKTDLRLPFMEAYSSAIGPLLKILDLNRKNLKKWMKPRKRKTSMLLQPGKSFVLPEPYGSALIISPWNYPTVLSLAPLIGAIAAGNCAVLKPSEISGESEQFLRKLIEAAFPPEYITVITGGPEITGALAEENFDYLFFTGSTRVGRIIMEKAAKHLIPVTLELGGINPCILTENINIKNTARRILFGKFYNLGQTCVAPNNLYVPEKIKPLLIEEMKRSLKEFYGQEAEKSTDYGRLISVSHLERLEKMLKNAEVITGGKSIKKERFLAPTLVNEPAPDSPLMTEEIFGPILPVTGYNSLDQLLEELEKREKPLVTYLYTTEKETIRKVSNRLSSGSLVINQTTVHLSNQDLPFGGVGSSGMGKYHGVQSFNTFSHFKSVYHRKMGFEMDINYPPYTEKQKKFLKKILLPR